MTRADGSTQRMDPKYKSSWVAALRSGKYVQGRGFLRTADDKFCCLGVLADIYLTQNPELKWERQGCAYEFCGCLGGLVETPLETERLITENRSIPVELVRKMYPGKVEGFQQSTYVALTELNDTHNFTFEEIANLIEAYF